MGQHDMQTTLICADYAPNEHEAEWIQAAFAPIGSGRDKVPQPPLANVGCTLVATNLGESHMPKTKARTIKKRTSRDRYVVPSKDRGGWDIVQEGHRRATAHARTKAEAVATARKTLRAAGGGELRIVNRSGKLTDSDTIPPTKKRAKR
jgi:Uncharacterized protein conserved in bacteria (DUF2188)